MHTTELFKKLFPVLSDHFVSEGVLPPSSASSEASSRDGLILDSLTGDPGVDKAGFSTASLSGKVSSGVGWIFAGVYVFKEIFLPGRGII